MASGTRTNSEHFLFGSACDIPLNTLPSELDLIRYYLYIKYQHPNGAKLSRKEHLQI
ncbi:Hypothetical protein FKW44_013948, partial [Caligus rogercresseyi]